MTKENVKSTETRAVNLEKQVAELSEANRELKERLIDSMDGEIQARRKLEQVRGYAATLEQKLDQGHAEKGE